MDEQRVEDALSKVHGDDLSIGEVASILGVSERSAYGYVEHGKLPGVLRENRIVVPSEAVACFERRAPGRLRTTTPRWHVPPRFNEISVTTLTVRARAGQGTQLADRLKEMRCTNAHCLAGTAARYIARNQRDPDEIQIVLVWRSSVLPPIEEREAALSSLALYLDDVLDWETVVSKESQVLLHAL